MRMDDKPFLHGSGPFSIATVCRLKTKNSSPSWGESWLTRFHPDYVKILKVLTYLLGPLTGPTVSLMMYEWI